MRRALAVLAASATLLAAPAAAAPSARSFGVYVDPWNVGAWSRDVGRAPQYVARFEAFSRGTTVDAFLREAERQGLRHVLVSWEPWRPVSDDLGVAEQFRPQPGYRNRDIAGGVQDAYIVRFARSLATFRGRVDVRYAHEMNGTWYPWSVNPSLYVPFARWRRSVRVYWPGRRYVDAVGSTMINFGGVKRYSVGRFVPRLRALRRMYRKPVYLTEVNTARRGRVRWLRALRQLVRRELWIRSVAWFQHRSRAQTHVEGAGILDWDVRRDPRAAAVVRGIMRRLAAGGAGRRARSRPG
jgi:mannan endo-1,4-beta-mannosidase